MPRKRKSDHLEEETVTATATAANGTRHDNPTPDSASADEREFEDELESLRYLPITDNCDVVRRKIRALIDSGQMKVGEFQKAITVTPGSYSAFMGQNGPGKGAGSNVYSKAFVFFKLREQKGIKNTAPLAAKKQKTASAANKDKDKALDLSGIELEGEMEDDVEVYDTCDEIRRKINAYLKRTGVTQAQFLRDLEKQYHVAPKKIQSKQLNDFRSKKGPTAGNTSCIFYAAYVFFEKLRIKEKKPKSQHRKEMEEIYWDQGGMDVTTRDTGVFVVGRDTSVGQTKYGEIFTFKSGRR